MSAVIMIAFAYAIPTSSSFFPHSTLIIASNPLLPRILSPLLTPPLRLLNPLIIRPITLLQFCSHHALQQFTNKANKVMSSQRILPQPLCAPVFLLLEFLLIADLAGANAQVTYAGHEVEADFGGGVAGDAAL
jgi:hypothetical protein